MILDIHRKVICLSTVLDKKSNTFFYYTKDEKHRFPTIENQFPLRAKNQCLTFIKIVPATVLQENPNGYCGVQTVDTFAV